MSEAISFISGLIAMGLVWFGSDYLTYDGPYRRGYRDALRDFQKEEDGEQDDKQRSNLNSQRV